MHRTVDSAKPSKLRGCFHLLGRVLVGLLLFVLVLAIAGYIYEHYASDRDMKQYPPPGQLLQIENHRMHLYCTGSGSPTVILESQANSSALDWGLVQPEIAKSTRVCSYDRAGFAWSELGPEPRTAQQAANELAMLLNTAGEKPPYILVGASYGGHVVRLFANAHSNLVAGMVLVDARPEKLLSVPLVGQQWKSSLGFTQVIVLLGDFGVVRPLIALIPDKLMPAVAAPSYRARPGSYEIVFQSKLWHASYAEALAMETSDAQVAAVSSMGNLPLVVIRHGKPMFGSLPAADAEMMETQWRVFQEEIAAKSTAGRLVVAQSSGHAVQFEQPAIVVEYVQQLLKK